MPALFVGHGSPMNAIEENEYHHAWLALGQRLPRPKAIMCVSAHWVTQGIFVTASEQPETIHDFYGFPKKLFAVRYPAPGDPSLARRAGDLLKEERVRLDPDRGLDHGCWSVLSGMYPKADVPVVQLSLDLGRPGTFHYDLAKKLALLRDEGVLIIGSGNFVHNLGLYQYGSSSAYDWAFRFDKEIKKRILAGEHKGLAAYDTLGPDARLAIPTPEHYLPLLYALALQGNGDQPSFFNETVESSISMTSVVVGGR